MATPTDDCIDWPYGRDAMGYGVINIGGTYQRTHALSCEWTHGPNPGGLVVAHSCGRPNCVNPRHLRWATITENAHDKEGHGTVVYGVKHPNARLTEDDVREIRASWEAGVTFSDIARHYGIHRVHARNIVRLKVWARVP